jgi:hypothetical protein
MTTTDVRVFTVAKATSALPLVRRIVADLVDEYPRWKDLVARYELLSASARSEWGESTDMQKVRRDIDTLAEHIEGFRRELEQIGCHLKDAETGLVDFYSLHEGRMVCLCWKHGEDGITQWHELEAGFAGRQPITPEFLAAESDD